ncbi:MAG: nucleotidyltransferase family protein [Acidimicrobiia bacterium]
MTAAGDVLTAIAAYGLRDTTRQLPDRVLDADSWRRVLNGAAGQGLTGNLVHASQEGAFPASTEQQIEALERHESALGLDLRLERVLLNRTADLHEAGIATRVLKGPALAHTIYPDPGLRSFRDVDLLVPGRDYDAAIAVLCADGGRLRYSEPRPGFNRRFGKGVCITTPDGFEIDLHRTLAAGPFGLALDPDSLFSTASTFSLGGRLLEGLDPEARFIHACVHARLGDTVPRLVPLRDVAQILLHTSLDRDRVQRLCVRWRCGIVVQHAIWLTWSAFGITSATDVVNWARHHEPSAFERWALATYLGPDPSYARQAVAGLWAVTGVRAKAVYARTMLLPNPEYVHTRDGSYVRRLRRGMGMFVSLWRNRPGAHPRRH